MNSQNPILRTFLYLLLLVVVVLIYAYGWQVTEINLEAPQEPRRQEQVMRVLRGVLTPDLIERDEESMDSFANFMVTCEAGEPPASPPGDQGQSVQVTPTCGSSGDRVQVAGSGFRPNSQGYVYWIKPNGTERPVAAVKTDSEGRFSTTFTLPTSTPEEEPYQVRGRVFWPVGAPRPSEAVKLIFEKMIETIFLALMATTLAIPIAGALSFLAAGNLMRQLTTSSAGLLAGVILMPLGWIGGRAALGQMGVWGITGGELVWPVLVGLAALGGVFYALMSGWTPRLSAPPGFLQDIVRLIESSLAALVIWLYAGLLVGLGFWLAGQVGPLGSLGALFANFIGTIAELIRLLLPALGGLMGAIIVFQLGSGLSGRTIGRLRGLAGHGVGLVLGAVTFGLVLAGIGIGIARFYQLPNEAALRNGAAVAGAIIGGLVGAFLGTDRPFPLGMVLYYSTRMVFNGLRAIEPLIMAIVFSIWVGIGPFAGVLALFLHSIAALGKLYSEQVESIDPGPIEAIQATGANQLQTIVYGVIPQIVPPYVSFTIYRWDINVRFSTVIGLVGGGGIGFILYQWINLLRYRQAGAAMLAIAFVVAFLDWASAKLRERIV